MHAIVLGRLLLMASQMSCILIPICLLTTIRLMLPSLSALSPQAIITRLSNPSKHMKVTYLRAEFKTSRQAPDGMSAARSDSIYKGQEANLDLFWGCYGLDQTMITYMLDWSLLPQFPSVAATARSILWVSALGFSCPSRVSRRLRQRMFSSNVSRE